MEDPVKRLQAAQLDGRTANVGYRQTQLQLLHNSLAAQASDICTALVRDSGCTEVEAKIEFAVTMETLRHHYEGLDFDQSLKDEYCYLHGQENVNNVTGFGIAYIVPTAHSPLYSVISPLIAAIAAGNCILLELKQTLASLSPILQSLLTRALDRDTVAVTNKAPTNFDFLKNGVAILQDDGQGAAATALCALQSPSTMRTVAIVDRTADLGLAARELAAGRFSFSGRSPYAPDMVLVNEFVKTPFLEAAAREATLFLKNGGDRSKERERLSSIKRRLDTAAAQCAGNVVTLGSNGCIIDLKSKDESILRGKIDLPLLAVLSFTSLEDAIDIANSNFAHHPLTGRPYLASYIFAKPASGKYLGQFINARASFLNTLPVELLVGPAQPDDARTPLSTVHRYQRSMFETCRPMFISSGSADSDLKRLWEPQSSVSQSDRALDLMKTALKPLPPIRQALQARSVGFFEQGILTGLGVFGAPVAIFIGYLTYSGLRWLFQDLR